MRTIKNTRAPQSKPYISSMVTKGQISKVGFRSYPKRKCCIFRDNPKSHRFQVCSHQLVYFVWIGRFHAFENVHRMDLKSTGRGVRQFKTYLLHRLEKVHKISSHSVLCAGLQLNYINFSSVKTKVYVKMQLLVWLIKLFITKGWWQLTFQRWSVVCCNLHQYYVLTNKNAASFSL